MSDSVPPKPKKDADAPPAVVIVFEGDMAPAPTIDEARIVYAWLEEEWSQIFEGK